MTKMIVSRYSRPTPIQVTEDIPFDLSSYSGASGSVRSCLVASISILGQQFKRIRFAQGARPPIELIGSNSIRFSGIAGQINLAGITFLIRPKYSETQEWLAGWSRMLSSQYTSGTTKRVRRSVLVLPRAVQSSAGQTCYCDPVAGWFADCLDEALSQGPLSIYRRLKRSSRYVKGRILVEESLRRGRADTCSLVCSHSEQNRLNVLTGVLSLCCLELAHQVKSPSLRRKLHDLQSRLGPALPFNALLPDHLRRQVPVIQGYDEVLEFAFSYLKYKQLRNSRSYNNPLETWSVLADMDVCFESFVTELARISASKLKLSPPKTQVPRELFHRTWPSGGPSPIPRKTKPDVVLLDQAPSVVACLDAKYKINSGTDKSCPMGDLYQILSACIAFGTRHGVLVYPMSERIAGQLPEKPLFEIWESVTSSCLGERISVGMVHLDLRMLSGSTGLVFLSEQLAGSIHQLIV